MEEETCAQDDARSNPRSDRGRKKLENPRGAQAEGNSYGEDRSKHCRMRSGEICRSSVDAGSDPMEAEGTSGPILGGTCSDLNICAAETDEKLMETPGEEEEEECCLDINTKAPDGQLGSDKASANQRRSNAKEPRTKDGAPHCPPHGFVSVIGRRREMEDAVAAVPCFFSRPWAGDLHFFGVYDGHGGPQAATFCKEYFHEALAEELGARHGSEFCGREFEFSQEFWRKVMSACFMKVDSKVGRSCPNNGDFWCCQDTIAPENVGSTAVVAIVGPSEIVIANCGDSRAVLSRGGKAVPLSRDHKPDREDERCRIEAAGGRVICWRGHRVGGLLALSRSIGDRYLKNFVISEPEVTCTERREEDECLVLGSDGLWDVLSNDLACQVARKCLQRYTAAGAAANLLTKLALARGSADNITVLVVDLKNRRDRH